MRSGTEKDIKRSQGYLEIDRFYRHYAPVISPISVEPRNILRHFPVAVMGLCASCDIVTFFSVSSQYDKVHPVIWSSPYHKAVYINDRKNSPVAKETCLDIMELILTFAFQTSSRFGH